MLRFFLFIIDDVDLNLLASLTDIFQLQYGSKVRTVTKHITSKIQRIIENSAVNIVHHNVRFYLMSNHYVMRHVFASTIAYVVKRKYEK